MTPKLAAQHRAAARWGVLSDREFFEARISPEPNTGCWLWTGAVDGYGYGLVRRKWNGKAIKAHRFSLILEGRDPGPLHVLHACDQPSCVNPAHLRAGTHQDNMKDRDTKGRCQRGERQGSSRLTEADVLEIRRLFKSGEARQSIADRFATTRQYINKIAARKVWNHVATA